MKIYKLYDIDSPELFECMENVKLELKKSNLGYKNLFDKLEKMKNKYPNIRGVLEDEKICEMKFEDVKALLESINLCRELWRIEMYEIFYFGNRSGFKYLRRIGVI